MPQFKPKTNEQIRRMFGLAKPLNCGKEDLEDLARDVSGGRVERLSLLSFDEANAVIARLGGEPFLSGTPRRTVNYRRKKAGVPQLATAKHLKLMDDLAAKRGMSAEGLERLCRRMLKGNSRPRTTAETNRIVEALKDMNARDARSSKEAA